MRKHSNKHLLSLGAPLLVFIALFGFFHRKDNERVQTFPALITGIGIISANAVGRQSRRKKLLVEILNRNNINK